MIEILTRSHIMFDLAAPHDRDVLGYDIAASLSKICRFNGHCSKFYSVAEHSLNVCNLIGKIIGREDPELEYAALLHDAHEAYTGDMVAPLRADRMMDGYNLMCTNVQHAVHRALVVPPLSEHDRATIKVADQVMLALEAVQIMGVTNLDNWISTDVLKLAKEHHFKLECVSHEDAFLGFSSMLTVLQDAIR